MNGWKYIMSIAIRTTSSRVIIFNHDAKVSTKRITHLKPGWVDMINEICCLYCLCMIQYVGCKPEIDWRWLALQTTWNNGYRDKKTGIPVYKAPFATHKLQKSVITNRIIMLKSDKNRTSTDSQSQQNSLDFWPYWKWSRACRKWWVICWYNWY